MKNFPFKTINPDTGEEQTFWYSRSMAAALFVFAPNFVRKWYNPLTWFRKQKWFVLANKRGPGCPDFIGCWCCPCGYLDYDETLKEAAIRECKEETGVIIPIDKVKFAEINDDPKDSNRQNVTARFYTSLNSIVSTSNSDNEEEETSDIQWIPIKELNNYDWAFNHDRILTHILKNYLKK